MHLKFRVPRNDLRPVPLPSISEKINGDYIKILFDTGANVPVFNGNLNKLLTYFPNVICTNKFIKVNGYGGSRKLPVYKIDRFELCGDEGSMVFEPLYVALSDTFDIISFDLILSYTLFNRCKLSFDIDNSNHIISVDSDKNIFHTALRHEFGSDDNEVDSMYSFVQDEESATPIEDNVSSVFHDALEI